MSSKRQQSESSSDQKKVKMNVNNVSWLTCPKNLFSPTPTAKPKPGKPTVSKVGLTWMKYPNNIFTDKSVKNSDRSTNDNTNDYSESTESASSSKKDSDESNSSSINEPEQCYTTDEYSEDLHNPMKSIESNEDSGKIKLSSDGNNLSETKTSSGAIQKNEYSVSIEVQEAPAVASFSGYATDKDIVTSTTELDTAGAIPLTQGKTTVANTLMKHEPVAQGGLKESRCIDLIERTLTKLKNEDGFVELMKKLFEATNNDIAQKRTIKYELINSLLQNLEFSDFSELQELDNRIRGLFLRRKFTNLLVEDNCFSFLRQLDEGSFTSVYEATLTKNGESQKVAVKRALSPALYLNIAEEGIVMCQFQHENIVKMIAMNMTKPEIAIELMELGSLNKALWNFSDSDLLNVLENIASGMEYMHEQQFLHRNLACKCILVNKNKQAKISGFKSSVFVGHCGGVYLDEKFQDFQYQNNYNVSPETVSTNLYTTQTDVWAMGILIWEVYYTLSPSSSTSFNSNWLKDMKLMNFQLNDESLQKPERCPGYIYNYCMEHVLSRTAANRPSFKDIKAKMQDIISKRNRKI